MSDKNELVTSEVEAANTEAASDEAEMTIIFKNPYLFEGKEYLDIDLSGLESMTAADMIRVSKQMQNTGAGFDVLQEMSTEYAMYFAALATKMPVEFFMGLPAREAMRVKNRVRGFLFG